MTATQKAKHLNEAKQYVAVCSDNQVLGVIDTEKTRLGRVSQGEVASVARIMLSCAIQEAKKRHIY